MPESEDERNRTIVDALRSTLVEAVRRLAPENEPALLYTLTSLSETLAEASEDAR